jgi:hypothetical protein
MKTVSQNANARAMPTPSAAVIPLDTSLLEEAIAQSRISENALRRHLAATGFAMNRHHIFDIRHVASRI